MAEPIRLEVSDCPFKVGDKIELLSEEEIDKNKEIYRFDELSKTTYDSFRRHEKKIINISKLFLREELQILLIEFKYNGTQSSLYYPLEIGWVNPLVVELI